MIYYRCNQCRTRNGFNKQLDLYVRKRHCKNCGHDKFYFDKERNKRSVSCLCQGYWFPHRPGSKACSLNIFAPVAWAERAKRPSHELLLIHFECLMESLQ